MSVLIPLEAEGVVVEIRIASESTTPPRCDGVLMSLARASGTCEAAVIEVHPAPFRPFGEAQGSPFSGDTWRCEWARSESDWVLKVGIPNVIFARSFDPAALIALEAVDLGAGRIVPLGSISLTVAAPVHSGGAEFPDWLPASLSASAEQLGL